ncbi:transcriptional regulator [Lysobacteraceae bacterium NML120232]|nr:transcriptional regulator [Xanthomonadaceae bacterium NML08-0793]PJK13731.1 transcriptional regulator [Xanthomonadaceae bacterium NML120232]
MEQFPNRLRAFRELRGWSQEHVGFELGVSKATVSKWETGRAEPSLQHLAALRQLYAEDGITLDYLIAGLGFSSPDADKAMPDADEALMVSRFRKLSLRQRKGLLALLAD